MELDPEESIMSMKLATFIVKNIDYDKYYTPSDFGQYLVKKLSSSTDWKSGLSKVISSKNGRDTVKQVYSFLSARGVHEDTIPSQEDTELGLKLTEDCMLWILKKVK